MLFKLFQIIQKDELSYSFSEVMLISVPKLGKNRSVSCKILFQLKKKKLIRNCITCIFIRANYYYLFQINRFYFHLERF